MDRQGLRRQKENEREGGRKWIVTKERNRIRRRGRKKRNEIKDREEQKKRIEIKERIGQKRQKEKESDE